MQAAGKPSIECKGCLNFTIFLLGAENPCFLQRENTVGGLTCNPFARAPRDVHFPADVVHSVSRIRPTSVWPWEQAGQSQFYCQNLVFI